MDGESSVRLGVIGLGVQGSRYARLLTDNQVPGMVLGAVAGRSPRTASGAADLGVPYFPGYQAMIDSGTVDAVVTTGPHATHPAMASYALEHGVHALVEKPIGLHTRQARELIAVAEAHPELTFAAFLNQRTNPVFADLKGLLDSGELGALRHTSWIITTWWRPQGYHDQSAWRATWRGEGGGVLVNQAPHQLDLWLWLCGVPRSVFAKCGYGFRRDIAVEDEVNALVDFGAGVTGSFLTSTHDLVGTDRLEILCDRGKVVVEDSSRVRITRLADDERTLSAGLDADDLNRMFTGGFDPSAWATTDVRTYQPSLDQHREVLRNFAAAIRGEEPLIAPGAEGIHAVRLANAIHLSSWLGREVSVTDLDEDSYLAELNRRIADEAGR
ncbi:MAG: Gfo/Idh/MocA family protein [Propioniciclava sp.]